jgi:hypothetical protein
MDIYAMFLDCPEYMDKKGMVRCGLPAEVVYRYTVTSTDGPLESARIRCPRGHWFNGPIESLILAEHPDASIHHVKGGHSYYEASAPARKRRGN